jgi:hypothetical protein
MDLLCRSRGICFCRYRYCRRCRVAHPSRSHREGWVIRATREPPSPQASKNRHPNRPLSCNPKNDCHSERSEESLYFVVAFAFALAFALQVPAVILTLSVAEGGRIPKKPPGNHLTNLSTHTFPTATVAFALPFSCHPSPKAKNLLLSFAFAGCPARSPSPRRKPPPHHQKLTSSKIKVAPAIPFPYHSR